MKLPPGIPGIDYNLINKCNEILIKCNEYKIIELPKNIPGINYDLIKEYNKLSVNIKIIRLEPPYTIPCMHIKTNNCQKTAAFKDIINDEYYCWFHMHCTN